MLLLDRLWRKWYIGTLISFLDLENNVQSLEFAFEHNKMCCSAVNLTVIMPGLAGNHETVAAVLKPTTSNAALAGNLPLYARTVCSSLYGLNLIRVWHEC